MWLCPELSRTKCFADEQDHRITPQHTPKCTTLQCKLIFCPLQDINVMQEIQKTLLLSTISGIVPLLFPTTLSFFLCKGSRNHKALRTHRPLDTKMIVKVLFWMVSRSLSLHNFNLQQLNRLLRRHISVHLLTLVHRQLFQALPTFYSIMQTLCSFNLIPPQSMTSSNMQSSFPIVTLHLSTHFHCDWMSRIDWFSLGPIGRGFQGGRDGSRGEQGSSQRY